MSVTGNSLSGNQYDPLTTVWADEGWTRRQKKKKKVMETMSDVGFVEDIVELL